MGFIGDLLIIFVHPCLLPIHVLILVMLELMIMYGCIFVYWWLIPLVFVAGILLYPLLFMSWENGFIRH